MEQLGMVYYWFIMDQHQTCFFASVFRPAQLRKVFYYGEDYHQQYLAKPGPRWEGAIS